jgi:hypothetical protein
MRDSQPFTFIQSLHSQSMLLLKRHFTVTFFSIVYTYSSNMAPREGYSDTHSTAKLSGFPPLSADISSGRFAAYVVAIHQTLSRYFDSLVLVTCPALGRYALLGQSRSQSCFSKPSFEVTLVAQLKLHWAKQRPQLTAMRDERCDALLATQIYTFFILHESSW